MKTYFSKTEQKLESEVSNEFEPVPISKNNTGKIIEYVENYSNTHTDEEYQEFLNQMSLEMAVDFL